MSFLHSPGSLPSSESPHPSSSQIQAMSNSEEAPRMSFQSTTLSKELLSDAEYERSYSQFHHHTVSDSTNTTGSNDSSPTTTISTVDDSSATEPSPGSSPESPPPTTFVGMLRPRTSDESRGTFFELQKSPPPSRKGARNLKNLAVNTSAKPGKVASTTSLPIGAPGEQTTTTILSPSFVKPPTPPRRRPSNLGLTILTPGSAKAPPQEIKLSIPPTPGFSRPALRHFQSSPSLPLVTGFSLPASGTASDARRPRPLPLETLFSPLKESFRIEEEEEQNFDVPLSKEEKPEAYPDGPICVYEPSIDLYLEPTAEQARKYDVIFNVASEVRNPFVTLAETPAAEPELRIDGGGGIQYAPKREHLAAYSGEDEAHKQDASPTTPKATPSNATFPQTTEPEYIHIPWEHNSDIVPELFGLCKQMDERVKAGKRVLVHCQCGVSRSASLVVAYGLYKAPLLSVQEAYDAVKGRSKWIGPNMNLIMQLQEFRSSLANGGRLASNRGAGMSPITPSSAISDWRSPFSMRSSSSFANRNGPMSAGPAPMLETKPSEDLGGVTPGPSSAPSGFAWPTIDRKPSPSIKAMQKTTAFVDPSGHVLPVLRLVESDSGHTSAGAAREVESKEASGTQESVALDPPMSPRATEFAMAPLQPTRDVDSEDSFGLMSPTSTEFSSNPFDRSALLASLGMGSMGRDEDKHRRSLSIRSKEILRDRSRDSSHELTQSVTAPPPPPPLPSRAPPPIPLQSGLRRLEKKISAPSLREQEQLQSLQAKIKAKLLPSSAWNKATTISSSTIATGTLDPVDEALLSPRATEFTTNPFALPSARPAITTASMFPSPAETIIRPRTSDGSDPRSPPQKGANPITRNILDVL